MLGIEEIGFVVVTWGVTSLIFRDWVVRFDLAMRARITGDSYSDEVVAEQQQLLERTGRIVLAVGLVVFAAGVGTTLLHLT
ncbi:MAG TPA: hypothetical protein VIN56_01100 [Candidatus Dormibacteraeota bacterium]